MNTSSLIVQSSSCPSCPSQKSQGPHLHQEPIESTIWGHSCLIIFLSHDPTLEIFWLGTETKVSFYLFSQSSNLETLICKLSYNTRKDLRKFGSSSGGKSVRRAAVTKVKPAGMLPITNQYVTEVWLTYYFFKWGKLRFLTN
jgi:hypothetical protein